MKHLKVIFTAAALWCAGVSHAQYAGDWSGNLQAGGVELPIVFHISQTKGNYAATMDSPKQQAFGLKVKSVSATAEKIVLDMSDMGILYEGKLRSDSLLGIFSQAGRITALNLTRGVKLAEKPHRPQEPKPKYPYSIQDVTFPNEKVGIRLAGTLTMPKGKGPFPAVVLVSGSGPQNRDEEVLDHKPFWIIADYLTKKGIAVLRYDDRGVAGSGGVFSTATSADFASDAAAALDHLRKQPKINLAKTGIIGHSEGGMIAPMVAANDNKVGFIVLLAGPGVPIDKLMMKQTELGAISGGATPEEIAESQAMNARCYAILRKEPDNDKARAQLTAVLAPKIDDADALKSTCDMLVSPWFRYFIAYDPQPVLEKVKCPVLAINGDKDQQVTSAENLAGIRESLTKGGNKKFEIHEAKNKNHLFQTTLLGLPSEYGSLEETFSPEILELMTDWILKI